jgi:phytol kinase
MIELVAVALSLVGIWILLVIGEELRKRRYHPEITRKFVHITVASFAATWPFYMSFTHIELISLILFFGVLFSQRYQYFHAVRDVGRRGWGELFFAMSIGFTALLAHDPWVFSAAMLALGVADGLAAIIGTLFGDKHKYKVLGATKTRAGTITFYIAIVLIIWLCAVVRGPKDSWTTLVWLPIIVTIAENIGVDGMDNLFIPILVAISL